MVLNKNKRKNDTFEYIQEPDVESNIVEADGSIHRELIQGHSLIEEGSEVFIDEISSSSLLEGIREARVPRRPRHPRLYYWTLASILRVGPLDTNIEIGSINCVVPVI